MLELSPLLSTKLPEGVLVMAHDADDENIAAKRNARSAVDNFFKFIWHTKLHGVLPDREISAGRSDVARLPSNLPRIAY
ncbi:hypothetical protein G3N57_12195 [Paraburkholderia sp. Se-20369]|nr:hypothetical protein [Paraburkholderia sp. Se-20369]